MAAHLIVGRHDRRRDRRRVVNATRTVFLATVFLACSVYSSQAPAQTEPQGGQPAFGAKPSVPDLDEQVVYQRAFEAVVWAQPAGGGSTGAAGVLPSSGCATTKSTRCRSRPRPSTNS